MGKSLFILGNGFDIMHKLPTKYADFREYLKKTYTITKHDEYAVPTVLINNAGEPFALDFEVAIFGLIYLMMILTWGKIGQVLKMD